jgi:hypothetical protein
LDETVCALGHRDSAGTISVLRPGGARRLVLGANVANTMVDARRDRDPLGVVLLPRFDGVFFRPGAATP